MAEMVSLLVSKINLRNLLPPIAVLFLVLVHGASSWRAIDSNNLEASARARQLRKLDQSGWRILAPASALPKFKASIVPRNRPQEDPRTDVNIVSVSTPINQFNYTTSTQTPDRANKSLAIEWDDDGADENSNETDPFENFRLPNPKTTVHHYDYPRQPKSSLGSAVKFEFKDTAASGNKILEQSQNQLAATTTKLQGARYFRLAKTSATSERSLANNHYKLIYHGQIKNGTKPHKSRIVLDDDDDEGLEFDIDTHTPLTISRRSFSSPLSVGAPRSSPAATTTSSPHEVSAQSAAKHTREAEADVRRLAGDTYNVTASPDPGLLPIQNQESSGSSSDWRPIVVPSTRTRRSGKTHKPPRVLHDDSTEGRQDSTPKTKQQVEQLANLDYKWRPITADRVFDLNKKKPATLSALANDEQRSLKVGRQDRLLSRVQLNEAAKKIEQPFEREDETDESEEDKKQVDFAKSFKDAGGESQSGRLDAIDRWTPLETTTSSPKSLRNEEPTTTTQRPTNGSLASESAQRSASDLNYIYSSQPVVQQQQLLQQQQTNAGAAYYSNYLVSAPQVQQQQQQQQVSSIGYGGQQSSPAGASDELGQLTSTLVDNTSGQTPEMIVDRAPPLEPAPTQYGYSQPQSVASFQPALPASRQPFYGNYANSYDTSSSYYNSMRALQQQQSAPPVRQTQPTPSAQVIRQEHHYHYHTPAAQPTAAPPERQLVQAGQQSSPAPTIIRELQPIMISQPVVQQQQASSTTSPAPTQVIREIIREVPAQTASQTPAAPLVTARFVMAQPEPQPQQVFRIQMAPAPPPPPPSAIMAQMPSVVRDGSFESAYGGDRQVVGASPSYAAHSAKRLMRQLTNSMPQVAIRMPMPQFRLQVPAIQLPGPMRVATPAASLNRAPVTRQTGSFIIPPMPTKTTTLMTETQAMPTHTTIMQTTQFTPATRTTVYTTDHQTSTGVEAERSVGGPAGYKAAAKK